MQDNSTIEWDTNTLHANKFGFGGNFVYKVYSDGNLHQFVGKAPLKRSTTIKATIKKYGGWGSIVLGFLTESKTN